jgi:glycerol-3-phosphate dehydrogenase
LNQEGLVGSALFYDHQIMMPERLVLENVISAREAGAGLRNYMSVEKIEESEAGLTVSAKDMLTEAASAFRAKVLINAAGPWIDRVRQAGDIDKRKIIYPTKGTHLVLPKLSDQALFVTSRDGRMFFIIPFGACSLIGTTDTKYNGDLDEVHAGEEDVDYLLKESRRILPKMNLTKEAILYTYAGIRPLAFSGGSESKISRKHRVIKEGRTGRIITIAGGKLTTYRNMAKDAVNAACRVMGNRTQCVTDKKPLPGGLPVEYAEYLREAVPELAARHKVAPELARHLIGFYGSRAEKVLMLASSEHLGREISTESRDIEAQVLYSVLEEGARTLTDVVLRRMHLGTTASRGRNQVDKLAEIAGRGLAWSGDEKLHHINEFNKALRKETACLSRPEKEGAP